jgi:hypothetical protein
LVVTVDGTLPADGLLFIALDLVNVCGKMNDLGLWIGREMVDEEKT